jgi:ceroid-lipofuscinosis MFS transporter 7
MSFTIYSKLIGPRPQGFWQGILTSFGSLARTIGPIAVSTLYDGYGPRFTFSAVGGLVLLNILTILLTLKRYEPYKFS